VDFKKFEQEVKGILGSSLKKPRSVRLGYKDVNGVERVAVPRTIADEPQQYYFSEGGGQTFVGQAFLKRDALEPWKIRFGAPVRVQQDALNDAVWVIIGEDTRYSDVFFDGVVPDKTEFVDFKQITGGLLGETIPASMRLQVLSAMYSFGEESKYFPTQQTFNFALQPLYPLTNGTARFVLVQLRFSNGLLEYEWGDPISSALTAEQVYQLQVEEGNTNYIKPPSSGCFRCGYVKLIAGMTSIKRGNLWAVQEYLAKGGGPQDLGLLSRIVCTDTDVVVSGGEVVWA
jgi:hypothetical protein